MITPRWMNTKTRPDIRHKVLKKHLPKRWRYGPSDSRIDGPTDRRTDKRTDPLTELLDFMRLYCRRKGLAFRGGFCSVAREFPALYPAIVSQVRSFWETASISFLFSERNVIRWFWAVCAHRVTRIGSRMAMWHCCFPICYPPLWKVREGLDKSDFCCEYYILFPEIPIVRAYQWKVTLLIAPRFLELPRKSVSLTSGSRTK